MELQGRNFAIEMRGEDVRLLQSELQKPGYALPAEETEEVFFGEATCDAVLDFQRKRGLPLTGVVDEHMARVVNAAVEARPQEQSTSIQDDVLAKALPTKFYTWLRGLTQ